MPGAFGRQSGKEDSGTLRDRAYRELKQAILSGEFASGTVFTQRQLAARLGVSRTPVRDCVLRLEQEGLLKLLHGGMATVSTVPLEDIKRTYEVRALLEGFAARQAAGRIDQMQLRQLEELVELQEAMTKRALSPKETQNEFFRLDNEFHSVIVESAHNPILASIVFGLMTLTEFQSMQAKSLSVPGRLERSVSEHREILGLLSGEKSAASDKAMRAHLEGFCRDVIEYWMR